MSTNDRLIKYRAHAEQCRAMADLSHPKAKEAFLAAAQEWELLEMEIREIESARAFVRRASKGAY